MKNCLALVGLVTVIFWALGSVGVGNFVVYYGIQSKTLCTKEQS